MDHFEKLNARNNTRLFILFLKKEAPYSSLRNNAFQQMDPIIGTNSSCHGWWCSVILDPYKCPRLTHPHKYRYKVPLQNTDTTRATNTATNTETKDPNMGTNTILTMVFHHIGLLKMPNSLTNSQFSQNKTQDITNQIFSTAKRAHRITAKRCS